MPIGRPRMPLPGGLSALEHEARRLDRALSKRAYAREIGIPQATYIRATNDAQPEKPRRPRPSLTERRRCQMDRKKTLAMAHEVDADLSARGVDIGEVESFLNLLGHLAFSCPFHPDSAESDAELFDHDSAPLRGCILCTRELRRKHRRTNPEREPGEGR